MSRADRSKKWQKKPRPEVAPRPAKLPADKPTAMLSAIEFCQRLNALCGHRLSEEALDGKCEQLVEAYTA